MKLHPLVEAMVGDLPIDMPAQPGVRDVIELVVRGAEDGARGRRASSEHPAYSAVYSKTRVLAACDRSEVMMAVAAAVWCRVCNHFDVGMAFYGCSCPATQQRSKQAGMFVVFGPETESGEARFVPSVTIEALIRCGVRVVDPEGADITHGVPQVH